MKIKLDKRLLDIFNLVEKQYSAIWDTCCDHGKLGLAFLESNKAHTVHFVDQVPSIIAKLKRKAEMIPALDQSRATFQAKRAQDIELKEKGELICICGVGGDVGIQIIKEIIDKNTLPCDFLICAQYHIFDLRAFLIENKFFSVREAFTFEGKWNYEVLLVSRTNGNAIDPVGKNLFSVLDNKKRTYLDSLVKHYGNKSMSDPTMKSIQKKYLELLK
ncbi:tRNA (adenine(22)-N(1))-methyltransferase TrmK [Halobacteriovorax sp. GB3]|uniref:tRNA (adenine(22)-N(1))-methyltransferase TrmK n=1 Tax=Halobacteriovorax sp. GB3 TaxID=2719615 RepID=UPI00236185A5|nr:tRNA (adenine(22)-N(1))-methyltransferase TrmK [Halobacteriovorax sp. GB3]MDD0853622.1 tRNA (adenine(22)-N(1))-methyltransferase TrmK [Halobacteriovorax sp. GB3]